MLEENGDRCQSYEGPPTPPLPSRAPPPPTPPSFIRSKSLVNEESLALTLLGRHTHFYDPNQDKKLDQLAFAKANFEELQARCSQMEKTMRWWSECTANWRDKWSKVRAERNRFKDELKILSLKHEEALSELNKQETESVTFKYYPGGIEPCKSCKNQEVQTEENKADVAIMADLMPMPDMSVTGFEIHDNDSGMSSVKSMKGFDKMSRFLHDVSLSEQSNTFIQYRLEEALKTLEMERSEKVSLQKEIDVQQERIATLECKSDELTLTRSDLTKELSTMKLDSNCKLRELLRQVDNDVSVKHNLQQAVAQLRDEIERLQAENAGEWGRRERLESEKYNLERQCKKLKLLNEDLRGRLDKFNAQNSLQTSSELSKLQNELEKQQNEGMELKHTNSKLKQVLSENNEELKHWQRKSNGSSEEVRGLRGRIEQLKQELGQAQDDFDTATTTVKRLERGNEELASQCEGLQLQIEHLTSRLRNVPDFDHMDFISRGGARFPNASRLVYQDEQQDTSSSTDENEFSFSSEALNETDV